MADESDSPLSSPPESETKVREAGPPDNGDNTAQPSSSSKSPLRKKVKLSRSRRSSSGHGEEERPQRDEIVVHASDEGRQRASSKRKIIPASKSAPAKKPRRAPILLKKSTKDKKWGGPSAYTDEKSPLASADLRKILLLPEAWDVLTQEERQEVLAKFPDDTHILHAGTPDARPNTTSLLNDNNFRHDCARYCENIKAGRHDEEWLSQAWVAHEKHKRGDFDAYIREQFEADWDIKLPEDSHPEENPSEEAKVSKDNDQSKTNPPRPLDSITEEPAPKAENQQSPVASSAHQEAPLSPQSAANDPPPQISHPGDEGGELGQITGSKQASQAPTPAGNSTTQHPSSHPDPENGDLGAGTQGQEPAQCIIVSQLA